MVCAEMAITTATNQGYMSEPKGIETYDTMVFGDQVHKIHTVVVHRFRMGDVEDPDLYAAQPLWEWQSSEMGKWVMERAVDTQNGTDKWINCNITCNMQW